MLFTYKSPISFVESVAAMLCARFQKDSVTENKAMEKWDFESLTHWSLRDTTVTLNGWFSNAYQDRNLQHVKLLHGDFTAD